MAYAFIMDFAGGTLAQYDEVIQRMGLADGGAPPRSLFHWVSATPEGLRVVDVWETEEAFERFAAEQIGPHTAAAGIEDPPTVTRYEVHNIIAPQPALR